MDKTRIIICDDEISDADTIAGLTRRILPASEIIICSNGKELMARLADYDIILLDIEMPDENGLELARRIKRKYQGIILIFVSGIKDYVFEAFTVEAFRYILKPVDETKLLNVLYAADNRRSENLKNVPLKAGKGSAPVVSQGHIIITSNGQHIAIPISDIVYAEIYNRIIILHINNGEAPNYYGRMSELEKLTGKGFFRCHRSYLVNLAYITHYDAHTIMLKTGTAAMAKNKYQDFVKTYLEYLNDRSGAVSNNS